LAIAIGDRSSDQHRQYQPADVHAESELLVPAIEAEWRPLKMTMTSAKTIAGARLRDTAAGG